MTTRDDDSEFLAPLTSMVASSDDVDRFDPRCLLEFRDAVSEPRQVTDACLIALVCSRDGRFVTFDRAVPVAAVRGATEAHVLVL